MSRGVQFWLFGSFAVAALAALAGCSHNFYSGERETWRRDADVRRDGARVPRLRGRRRVRR